LEQLYQRTEVTIMNKIFRLIWSRVKEAWVIVAEKVKGNGGPAPVTVGVALITASLAVGSGVATALPTGAQIASGTVGINTVGNVMTVTNSANAIINWQNFSIGNNETARFIQPSALSAVLNRVTGGNPSQILGALQSNGKVLLINPSGIIFGAGARVDVNGLIASSLDIANQDFLAGRMKFTAGPTAGKVENQGTITTPTGGSVYLIAPDVQNSGVITAPNGDVLLAAGKEVLLVDSSNPEIAMVVTAPDGQSINLGTIVADAGRVGMYGSVVRNSGRISANSAVSDATGRIFLKSTKKTVLEPESVISADGVGAADGGKVMVWSDGDTQAAGSITAKGGELRGNGGFVETSGATINFSKVKIDASSTQGRAGTWLIDPVDQLTIDTAGASALQTALDTGGSGTNTTVTNSSGAFGTVSAGPGAITVASPVTWSKSSILTLDAEGDILINAAVTGTIGTLVLKSPGSTTQTAVVTVDKLLLLGGAFSLAAPGVTANTLAADTTGSVNVVLNGSSMATTIGSVSDATATVYNGVHSSGGVISVKQLAHSLSVDKDVSAPNGSVELWGDTFTQGMSVATSVNISAGNDITLKATGQGSGLTVGSGVQISSSAGDILLQSDTNPANAGPITLNGGTFTAGSGKTAKFEVSTAGSVSVAGAISGNNLLYKTNSLVTTAKTTATGSITLLPATTGGVVDFGGGGSGVLVLPDGNLSTKFDTPILRLGMPGAGEKVGGVSFNPTANTVSGLNTLSIYSSGPVSQGAGATIGATALQVTASSVTLTEDNPVGVIAGKATTSDFSYKSTNSIAVSTVDGVVGITGFDPASCVYLTSDMGINQAAGSPITVNGAGLYLTAGGPVNLMEPTNAASGWFSAALTGSGSLNFTNSTGVTLSSISSSNQPISFTTSTGDLTVNNSINAGTSYVALKTPGNLFITGGGDPVSVSGQSVKLEASGLSMSYGGYGASVDASNISIATDTFTTSGAVALNATSGISIQTLTSGREIAVGTGATGAGLVLNDLSSALFNTPHLRIGNDNTTGSYGAYSGTIAVGGSGISRPTLQLGLTTAGAISQTAPVAVSSLGLISGSGQNIVLMDSTNSVASLAGKSGGQFSFAGTGSLGLASMTGGVPAVTLNGITASGAVTLISYGSITDSVASVPAVVAPSVALSAYSGIGSVSTPLKTQVSSLSATNSMTGDIQVINTGALTTGAVTNTGTTGKVSITAHSPLTIGAPLTAGGDIALTAGASGTGVLTDTLTINAAVTSSGGNIALSAGNGIVENAAVTPGSGKTVVRTASLNPPPACSSGYAWNGTACAPTLSTCTTDPSLPGCSGILPSLATCISAPATPGCSAVLPSIGACTENPTAPGCSMVLPSLATCTTTPTAPGCSAVLPTIATCTSAPSTPGCSAVLPTIAACTATPTAPGCSAVLPTIATCTSAPTTPGCSAVLPTIGTCTITPTAPGCSAVLPTIATCTSAPSTPGCSAVLPTIVTCTTTPTAPGCSAVLPTIATCTSAPTTPGCSAVLPTIVTCTTTPTAPGCSVVLPTMATCTSAPTTPGCSVVLPSIATCTSAPASPGCSVVLPSLTTCITTPSAPGCSVVLPTIAICSSSPATPGCSAVMPSLATCIASPGTIGCGAVLPSMQSCVAAPTTPGCSAVLPTLADCAANPSAPGCVVVVPVVENKELAPKTNQLVNSLNPLPTSPVTPAGLKLIAQAPPAQSTSGGGGGTGDGGNNSEDKDKDKNRNGQGQPPTGGGNTDEKPKKNYCN
jgi:filamentous hemagglutinin family protein